MQNALWLYAEYLLHIKTLIIFVELPTLHNSTTTLTLSADGCFVKLYHDSEKASLKLPVVIHWESTPLALQLPKNPSRNLNVRLNVGIDSATLGCSCERITRSPVTLSNENPAPWTAESMDHDLLRIRCRTCSSSIIRLETVKTWLNLPSEDWAELMEFWHCQKPNEPAKRKGKLECFMSEELESYSASNMLGPHPGCGYASKHYFLLHKDDCNGIEVRIGCFNLCFIQLFAERYGR